MKNWKQEEVKFLKEHYPTHGALYCSENLGRTIESVQSKAARLGMKRDGVCRYNKVETPDGYSYCFACEQTLEDSRFYKKSKIGKYGKKANLCRSCAQQRARKNYKENLSSELKRRRENPVKFMLKNIKSKAKKHGIPFDIEESDVIIPKQCPVLGIEIIQFDQNKREHSPSIDRLDPSKGYVKGNINVISSRANRIKTDATIEEVEKVYKWYKKQLGDGN